MGDLWHRRYAITDRHFVPHGNERFLVSSICLVVLFIAMFPGFLPATPYTARSSITSLIMRDLGLNQLKHGFYNRLNEARKKKGPSRKWSLNYENSGRGHELGQLLVP